MPEQDDPPIITVGSRIAFQNRWTTLVEDEIERPGGLRGHYAVIEKRRAALIVPWDGERLHLIRQWRYPVKAWSIEFPQGTISSPPGATAQPDQDEPPELIARTELKEELGFTAGTLVQLGTIAFAPGISNQFCDLWLASDLVAGEAEPEPEEQGLLEPLPLTPAELDAVIDRGEVTDAATLAAWGLVQRRELLNRAR